MYNVHIISNFDGYFYVNSQRKNIKIPREIYEEILRTGDQRYVLEQWRESKKKGIIIKIETQKTLNLWQEEKDRK